ncbi:hypothetical protein C8R45DRAFT_998421 [Mycena sanguinolenta]|nr:hypothetical protein C8R45DRAFT_998421 [Mycena sanguinolenta]
MSATSTAVEILVQIPGTSSESRVQTPDSEAPEILEISLTASPQTGLGRRVKSRGPPTPGRSTLSELESGTNSSYSTHEPLSSIDSSGSTDAPQNPALAMFKALLSLGVLIAEIFLAVLPVVYRSVFVNVLLFRRPQAYASELEPIVEQAEHCRPGLHPLCSGDTQAALPPPLVSLQEKWEKYLELKYKEWSLCSYGAGILVGFVLGALQIAEQNDPLTRVSAFIAFAVLAFSLMASQLLSYHLSDKPAKEVHYAYHFLESVQTTKSSTWNMHCVLSISSVSTWWAIILSAFTFGSVFYHDTESTASSVDSNLPLSLWEMVTSRVLMVAILLVSGSCLFSMHATLKSYGKCVPTESGGNRS